MPRRAALPRAGLVPCTSCCTHKCRKPERAPAVSALVLAANKDVQRRPRRRRSSPQVKQLKEELEAAEQRGLQLEEARAAQAAAERDLQVLFATLFKSEIQQ